MIDALTAEQLEDLGRAARRIVAVANPGVAATLTGTDSPCADPPCPDGS